MNENHDAGSGQFTSSEPVFGREAAETEAGYVPFKEEKEEKQELTTKEAAEELTAAREAEGEIKVFETGLPDNVSLTVDQAAKVLLDAQDAERAKLEELRAEQIRKEVDELRGEDKAEEKATEQPAEAFDPAKALEHPQVKEAIEKVTAETEAARLQHVSGLAAATQMAEATFFSQFPELAGLDGEQRVQAFAAIAQNDPQRAEQIRASVNGIANLFQQYSTENGKLAAEREANFRNYAKAESERFEEMIKDTPKARRAEIEGAIVEVIKEYGGDVQAFAKLMQGSEFASATVQRLLWDVGRLRLIEKTKTSAAVKPVPPVVRPGVAGAARASSADASISVLAAKLNRTGDARDAAALLMARRAQRG
jgi:hypothetical protein